MDLIEMKQKEPDYNRNSKQVSVIEFSLGDVLHVLNGSNSMKIEDRRIDEVGGGRGSSSYR